MSIDLFFFVFCGLVIISTQTSYFVNDRIFHIDGTFTRQYASWCVALVISSIFWAVCKLYGIELLLHFAITTLGLAAASNGYYDLRHCPF